MYSIKHIHVSDSAISIFILSFSSILHSVLSVWILPKPSSGCFLASPVLLLCAHLIRNKTISCFLQSIYMVVHTLKKYVKPQVCSRTVLLKLVYVYPVPLWIFQIAEGSGSGGQGWPGSCISHQLVRALVLGPHFEHQGAIGVKYNAENHILSVSRTFYPLNFPKLPV